MDFHQLGMRAKRTIRYYSFIFDEIDTESAAQRIKSSIWFRGPNAWILAFAIVLASVGLNVNSTAVIIGAMLVSPLMGPIIGAGLALGTNDRVWYWFSPTPPVKAMMSTPFSSAA